MPGAHYTHEAEQDLQNITQYIARDNPSAALTWLEEVRATCDLLATQPQMGESLRTARFGAVRRHILGNYLIYYVPAAHGIEVARIVHGAHDQGALV